MNTQVILGILRHVLTMAGTTSVMVSDNELQTLVSALVTAGSIAWSIFEKYQASKKAQG